MDDWIVYILIEHIGLLSLMFEWCHQLQFFFTIKKCVFYVPVDGGKNPSQQRGSLPVLQVPIRLTNVWYGRLDGIMDLLPSRG